MLSQHPYLNSRPPGMETCLLFLVKVIRSYRSLRPDARKHLTVAAAKKTTITKALITEICCCTAVLLHVVALLWLALASHSWMRNLAISNTSLWKLFSVLHLRTMDWICQIIKTMYLFPLGHKYCLSSKMRVHAHTHVNMLLKWIRSKQQKHWQLHTDKNI